MDSKEFWESPDSHVFCNPRLSDAEQARIAELPSRFPHLPGHVWIGTSGSSGPKKWVALSKKALLHSAQSVNQHLFVTKQDRWLNPLPHFHVGGLGVQARGYLGQFVVENCTWDALQFHQQALANKTTLSALVPTQIFDLVSHQLTAPCSMRAVIVGGGRLSDHLYALAIQLGWPLLPSYGLTECASQVATLALKDVFTKSPQLKLLSHINAESTADGFLKIQSNALLTGYAIDVEGDWQLIDPKKEGWLLTGDKGTIHDSLLEIFGRDRDFFKIGGENVSLQRLEKAWEEVIFAFSYSSDSSLIPVEDPRLGHVIHLAVTKASANIEPLVVAFNEKVLPFEKIRKVHQIDNIPKTTLGKVCYQELIKKLII